MDGVQGEKKGTRKGPLTSWKQGQQKHKEQDRVGCV